jgi:hypothetical protein
MNFFPFSRKPAKKASGKPSSGRKKSELAEQLDMAVSRKRDMDRKVAEIQRQIDEIPRQIKRREELEKQRIKRLAATTPTIRDPGRPVHRLKVLPSGGKKTRAEQRILLNRFLILCAVLGVMLVLLLKAVR